MSTVPAKIDGAEPKKLYMHYERDSDEPLTLKMTLPSKWAGHTVDHLKDVRAGGAVVDPLDEGPY